MGAIALGHSLTKFHGRKYDLLCLVTADVGQRWRRMLSQWWYVLPVDGFRPFPGSRRSWEKLRLWGMTE
jgi:hypothetical protein